MFFLILKTLINCPKCLDKLLGYDDYDNYDDDDIIKKEKGGTILYQSGIIVNSPKEIIGEKLYQNNNTSSENTNTKLLDIDIDILSNTSDYSWEKI